jgi:diketogulonate reductase-like aldo/keto reductase
MKPQECFVMENGMEIPQIGFGTWLIPNDEAEALVEIAIRAGYRHIDTAEAYGNEEGVGVGIRNSGIPRDKIFVTTKLRAEIKNYDEAKIAIDESIKKLNVGPIDLMIIHSPKPWAEFDSDNHYFEGNLEAWQALVDAKNEGKIKAIGVSNFEPVDLENILQNSDELPQVNQVLFHIGNTPFETLEYCQKHDILVEAYSPIAHGEMLANEDIKNMADKYHVGVAQLAVRYCLELGALPLPKSTSKEHIESNAEVDFEISEGDMNTLIHLTKMDDYGESSHFPVFKKKR